jgi:hypothetical protein
MLKFLKMMVAEDVTIMEEVLVAVLVAEEVLHQEEKETLRQEEKVQAVVSEATETQLLAKVVLEEEVNQEVQQLQELVVFQIEHHEDQMLLEMRVFQTEHQDVLKVPLTHLDQEDQEENNNFC